MAEKELALKEVLNITDKEIQSGSIDTKVVTSKLGALNETNPDMAAQVQEQAPALSATSTAIGTVQQTQEASTKVMGTATQVITQVKGVGECFVPVLMAQAIPKQAQEKIGDIQNLIVQQIPKAMSLIISALLSQTIKIKEE